MAGATAHFPSLDQAHLKELWGFSQLSAADRALLLRAFERDPSLRPELELLLQRVGPEVREQFVLAFVDSLGRAPRPAAAVMPALIYTVRTLRGSATPAELAVFDNWRSWGGGDAGRD
jgi:hypothetical protein